MAMKLGLGLGMARAQRVSGAAPFTPLSIPGLLSWIDAIDSRDAGNASFVDGVNYGHVSDLSGNGFNATEATGSRQPLFGVAALNSKPAFTFVGGAGGDSLEYGSVHASTLVGGTDNSFSVWAVCSFTGLTAANTSIVHGFGNTGTTVPLIILGAGSGASQVWNVDRKDDAALLITRSGAAVANSTLYVVEYEYSGTDLTVTDWTIPGSPVTLIATVGQDTGAITLNSSKLHGWQNGGTYLTGAGGLVCGAHLCFTQQLSGASKTALATYLATKWA